MKEKKDYLYDGQAFKAVRSETNEWSYSTNWVMDYIYGNPYPGTHYPRMETVGAFLSGRISYYGGARLQSNSVSTYNSDYKLVTYTERYEYNSRNQLVRKYFDNSLGQEMKIEYTYPEVNTNGTTPAITQKMVDKNMIAPVLKEETTCRAMSSTFRPILGYKVDYNEFTTEGHTFIMPQTSYQLDASNTTYKQHQQVLRYSRQGNPVEIAGKDELNTVYLWSYHDRYPIAQIENTTYSLVSAAVQSVFGISIETLAAQAQPDENKLRQLRNHASLRTAHVYTYTHKPLVGVTSITNPAGVTMHYEYDTMGRAKNSYRYNKNTISTPNKQLIQQYNYHFR